MWFGVDQRENIIIKDTCAKEIGLCIWISTITIRSIKGN